MLKELFKKYNSDKGFKHHYDKVYDVDFLNLKNKKINLLEIGILGGSSIKTWLEYFPNATIYAIDILPKDSVEILNNNRVRYLQHDSTDANIIDLVKQWNVQFDIIIEDGLHTPSANLNTFKNLIPFLKKDCYYYIEDFFPLHLMSDTDFDSKCGKFLKKKENVWNLKEVNNFLNYISKYNYKIYDHRSISQKQDSFIFKILKD